MLTIKYFFKLLSHGVDLSEHNFNKGHVPTKAELAPMVSRVSWAAIRVGLGRVLDKMFLVLWEIFRALGIRIFPYWYLDYYSHVNDKLGYSNEEWGRIQAEKAWRTLNKWMMGRLALDMEESSYGWRVNSLLQKKRYQEIAKGFLVRWKELSGQEAIIYCSMGWLDKLSDWFKDFDLWIAWYSQEVRLEGILYELELKKWRGKLLIWQYASNGDVNGDGIGRGREFGIDTRMIDLNDGVGLDESFWGGQTVIVVTPEDEVVDYLYKLNITEPRLRVRKGPGLAYEAIRNAGAGEVKVYDEQKAVGETYAFARISKTGNEWVSLDPRYSKKV